MSNIHRIGDYERNDNAPNRRNVSLFGPNMNSNPGNPREETFGSFLKNFCCPFMKLNSFIVIITVIDVAMYIATLAYDGIDDVETKGLLAPTFKALDTFGMSVNWNINL